MYVPHFSYNEYGCKEVNDQVNAALMMQRHGDRGGHGGNGHHRGGHRGHRGGHQRDGGLSGGDDRKFFFQD